MKFLFTYFLCLLKKPKRGILFGLCVCRAHTVHPVQAGLHRDPAFAEERDRKGTKGPVHRCVGLPPLFCVEMLLPDNHKSWWDGHRDLLSGSEWVSSWASEACWGHGHSSSRDWVRSRCATREARQLGWMASPAVLKGVSFFWTLHTWCSRGRHSHRVSCNTASGGDSLHHIFAELEGIIVLSGSALSGPLCRLLCLCTRMMFPGWWPGDLCRRRRVVTVQRGCMTWPGHTVCVKHCPVPHEGLHHF